MKGKLILEDGTEFSGNLFGDQSKFTSEDGVLGEVVFNTSLTGYQEILTDPSYCDQFVCMTYPLIGNYGLHQGHEESRRPALKGMIVRELSSRAHHWQAQIDLETEFSDLGLVGLKDVDTRALTKKIRTQGMMKGVVARAETPNNKLQNQLNEPMATDQIKRVSVTRNRSYLPNSSPKHHIVMIDYGYKKNILRELLNRECKVTIVPYNFQAEDVFQMRPDGVVLSNGPGDPRDIAESIEQVKELFDRIPMLGICMGHQVMALARGYQVEKMKFGHRGGNQPVKDLTSGRVYLTSQNHSYSVVSENHAPNSFGDKVSFVNINDQSIEGITYLTKMKRAFSVQFHPEHHCGPRDAEFLFDRFINSLTA